MRGEVIKNEMSMRLGNRNFRDQKIRTRNSCISFVQDISHPVLAAHYFFLQPNSPPNARLKLSQETRSTAPQHWRQE